MSQHQIQELPIQITNALIHDTAFSSMREKFLTEMKRIDDEITKFRYLYCLLSSASDYLYVLSIYI